MSVEFLTNLAAVAGVCIVAVNIIVEVLKSFLIKADTMRPLAVLIVSEVICFLVMWMYCEIEQTVMEPMIAAGTFVGGFFVAYGAMFGYEKLYGSVFKSLEKLLKKSEEDNSD